MCMRLVGSSWKWGFSDSKRPFLGHWEMGVFRPRNPLFPILGILTPVGGGRVRKPRGSLLDFCALIFVPMFGGFFVRNSTDAAPGNEGASMCRFQRSLSGEWDSGCKKLSRNLFLQKNLRGFNLIDTPPPQISNEQLNTNLSG